MLKFSSTDISGKRGTLMQSTLVRRYSVVALLMLSLTFSMLSVPVQASRPHHATVPATSFDGVATVTRLASLVRSEYRESVPQSRLAAGALKGIREYLKKNGYDEHIVPSKQADDMAVFRKAYATVVRRYPKMSQRQLSYAAIRGMLEVLDDPYTVFLDPEEYKSLMGQLNGGNFGGLGIYIESDDKNNKALTIVEPMDGTPAAQAGLKSRDVIAEIDGKSTTGMAIEEATRLLRGPVGSRVILTIRRPGVDGPFKVTVTRAQIHVKTLSHKVVNNSIGYVKLRVFGDNANDELEEAFRAFDKARVKAYILDLRNNGGGYITAALDVSSHFIPTGSRVVSVAERGTPEIVYNSRPNLREVLPVVVLVNKYSASASEITAGAIKDLHAGTLIGEKTFGKGSVQKIFPLPDGSAVKITTAHYHTPSGQDIHKKGILPDVTVQMKMEDFGEHDKDPQLQAALELLQRKITQLEGVAQHPNTDVSLLHADAIRVHSSDEEFDYISRLKTGDGGTYHVDNQTLVNENGRYYDVVELRSERGSEKKTLWFQLDYLRGK